MRNYLLFILLVSFSLGAVAKKDVKQTKNPSQEEIEKLYKKADSNYKKKYLTIAKFLLKDYITPIKKKVLPKLRRDLIKVKAKLKRSESKKSRLKYLQEVNRLQDQIELNNNWSTYLKAYIIYNRAYIAKDDQQYNAAYKICSDIEKRYKVLTGQAFPYLYRQYAQKYGPIKF